MYTRQYSKIHHTKPTVSNHGRGGSGKGRKVWACKVDGVEYVLTRKHHITLFLSGYLYSEEAKGQSAGSHQAGFEKWLVSQLQESVALGHHIHAREMEKVINTHKFL